MRHWPFLNLLVFSDEKACVKAYITIEVHGQHSISGSGMIALLNELVDN